MGVQLANPRRPKLKPRSPTSNRILLERNPPSRPARHSALPKSPSSFLRGTRRRASNDSRRNRRLHALRPAQGPQQDRLCRWLAHGTADVCGRGAGSRRRRAGTALCGPRRATAEQHDCRHGTQARRGLHRQRGQVPSAGQPHARARRGQHLLAVSLPPDRRGASAGSGCARSHGGHLSARRAPAFGRTARPRARLSRHEPYRHLSPAYLLRDPAFSPT